MKWEAMICFLSTSQIQISFHLNHVESIHFLNSSWMVIDFALDILKHLFLIMGTVHSFVFNYVYQKKKNLFPHGWLDNAKLRDAKTSQHNPSSKTIEVNPMNSFSFKHLSFELLSILFPSRWGTLFFLFF